MAVTTPTRDRLRALADFRPDRGRVLSLFFDLDPSQFATGDARAAQINSALDEAAKRIDSAGLDHDALVQARADLDRVRAALDPQSMGAGGARGVAVFAAGEQLLEFPRGPERLDTRVELDAPPVIEPLALAGVPERLHVALVSAGQSRLFAGTGEGLEEVADFADHIDKSVAEEERRDHFDT